MVMIGDCYYEGDVIDDQEIDVSLGTAEDPHLLQAQQSPQRCLHLIKFSLI